MSCLGENTEKYKTFSNPIEKEVTGINKGGNESVVTISYKAKFIDSARFMATSLSNLVNNLTEEIHKIKFNNCKCESNFIKYKCLSCNKDYSNKIDEELEKRFRNTFKFYNNDINKLILLFRKFILLFKKFISMSIWIIGKSLIKQHYMKTKTFVAT